MLYKGKYGGGKLHAAFPIRCDSQSFPANTGILFSSHQTATMAADPEIRRFNKGYNEARALYEEDKLDEAIARAEELLEEKDNAPRPLLPDSEGTY